VCIGINPSPVSVAAGHYYQGKLGQKFFSRLRLAGILGEATDGFEDDLAFATGIGFTDIIKRPTASAAELSHEEFVHGKQSLLDKLAHVRPALAIFTFKKTADVLFGPFRGNGYLDGRSLGDTQVFVMPGPYESQATAEATLEVLSRWWKGTGGGP
jgi:TDG/mug DNA glycosylase family protein